MVARATIAHCRALGDEVLPFTRQELDISDAAAVEETISRARPHAVINCAAYTDVDGSETHAELCYAANARGVENLAAAAKNINAVFVTISTDYVFNGEKTGFYTEDDKPDPLGVYGKAKLEGELRAKTVNPDSIIVRSGWIYGAGGTNFLSRVHLLLAEGKPVKAISDSYGTPTHAADLAKRLRELAQLNEPGIYHVTNAGDGTSYAGFARKAAEIKGYDLNLISDIPVDSLQRPAPRPRSSRLATLHKKLAPLPDWEKALETFLKM
jgi:dTDP-4-dehydrorhamnose reductase